MDEGSVPTLPTNRSLFHQFQALLWKSYLERKRNVWLTVCELCSNILIMSLLWYAYSLSDITKIPQRQYATVQFNITETLLDGFLGNYIEVLPEIGCRAEILNYCPDLEPKKRGDEDEIFYDNKDLLECLEDKDVSWQCNKVLENYEDIPKASEIERLEEFRRAATNLLRGPLLVPSLDEYVALGRFLSAPLEKHQRAKILDQNHFGRQFGNLLTLGRIHIVPAGEVADDFISFLQENSKTFSDPTTPIPIMTHESEAEAIDYVESNLDHRTWAVIILDEGMKKDSGIIDYTLRMNYTTLPNTYELVTYVALGLDEHYQRYFFSGFLTLQTEIDKWAFGYVGLDNGDAAERSKFTQDKQVPLASAALVPFPTAAYSQNLFYTAVGYLLGLALSSATLYPLSRMVKGLVEEREVGLEELMKATGLHPGVYTFANVTVSVLVFTWVAASSTFIACYSFLLNSSPSLVFVYFYAFCLSEVAFGLALSHFFRRARLASIAAPVALFSTLLPRYIFYGSNRYEATTSKYFSSLLSPTAFTFGADVLADYEYAEKGINWTNMDEGGGFTFGASLRMMIFDIFLYAVFGWYFNHIVPKRGPSSGKHPLFFLGVKWGGPLGGWVGVRGREEFPLESVANEDAFDCLIGNTTTSAENMEPVSPDLTDFGRVKIRSLVKNYPGGKRAVRGLSLDMYENQITCLLGHNGAGKSTTISVLTGVQRATRGDCLIWGKSITHNLQEARQQIGVCPQNNIIFPWMTVKEHLEMFALIKGVPKGIIGTLVGARVAEVGLEDKMDTFSSSLSGGMKRKLCVAIAFMGSPKFVLLDEPTSGMDPYSRRAMWDLLRRKKEGRVVLLTTHFMDEADLLGERIAIMTKGNLTCCGSSLFLKSRFGVGYNLTLVTSEDQKEKSLYEVQQLVSSNIEGAELLSSAGRELVYRLPLQSTTCFPSLLTKLEMDGNQLGVQGYGISITTLEEVFLKLGLNGMDASGHSEEDHEGTLQEGPLVSEAEVLPKPKGRKPSLFSPSRIQSNLQTIGSKISKLSWTPTRPQRKLLHKESEDLDEMEQSYDMRPLQLEMMELKTDDQKDTGEHETELPESKEIISPPSPMESQTSQGNLLKQEKHLSNSKNPVFRAKVPSWKRSHRQYANVSFRSQIWQLLKKRWCIAKRDFKSFFFQVIFPSLQILLVLSILTLQPKIAGPSILLSPDLFGESNQVLYTGHDEGVSNQNYEWIRAPTGISTSEDLSTYLLQRGQELHSHDLYGALSFEDHLEVSFNVDFPAIEERFELLLDLATASSPTKVVSLQSVLGTMLNSTIANFDMQPAPIVRSYLQSLGVPLNQSLSMINVSSYHLEIFPIEDIAEDLLGDLVNEVFDEADPKQISNIQELISDLYDVSSAPFNDIVDLFSTTNVTEIFQMLYDLGLESQAAQNLAEKIADGDIPRFDVNSDAILYFLEALQYENTSLLDAMDVTFDDVIYSFNFSDILTVKNFAVSIGDEFYELGDLDVSIEDFKAALPKTTTEYVGNWKPAVTVMHNSSGPHAISAFGNVLTDEYLTTYASSKPHSYKVRNHPLPLTARQSLTVQAILSIIASLFLLIPLCYIPAAFAPFYVMERARKAKHLQLASGIGASAYWIAAYLWDSLLFIILTCLNMGAFFVYGETASEVFMSTWESTICTALLLLIYGLSGIPLSYLYSFMFSNGPTAQISIMGLHFLSGFVAVIGYVILDSMKNTRATAHVLVHFFRFFPSYNMGDGLIRIADCFWRTRVKGTQLSFFDWAVAGRPLKLMLVEAVVYLSLVIIMEKEFLQRWYGACCRLLRPKLTAPYFQEVEDLDEDVLKEKTKVTECMDPRDHAILIRHLFKTYRPQVLGGLPKTAVSGLSVSVPRGECFGFLGINGAGKTTTLSILTRDLKASSGEAYIEGYNISDPKVQKMMGYCPQIDPLLDLMTARETLTFFGIVKGIPSSQISDEVEKILQQVGLVQYADIVAGNYSGGNKRKLSLGTALIGDPPVLLLDEPSTGMDPAARRHMWNVILEVAKDRCVVLTTHSMEECEALCSRVGIMAAGKLRCLGAPQHLKNRFSQGYQLEIKCCGSHLPEVQDFVFSAFPGSTLEEINGPKMKFRMSHACSSNLANVFSQIEMWKNTLKIEDYGISQCSLEQIFISFAREQEMSDQE